MEIIPVIMDGLGGMYLEHPNVSPFSDQTKDLWRKGTGSELYSCT